MYQALKVIGYYASSKWAFEAIYESLAEEVKAFGIKVTIIEPGAYATEFGSQESLKFSPGMDICAAYKQEFFEHLANMERGDPHATPNAIFQIVDTDQPPLRFFLGDQCLPWVRKAYAERLATWEAWEEVSNAAQAILPEELADNKNAHNATMPTDGIRLLVGHYREQLDYCFTPRGWLSKLTGKANGIENFGIELKYNIPANGAVAQYNGNIAEMLWRRASAWVGYKFAYDGVNRLTNGVGISGNTNREAVSEYDKNGNIKKLQRAFDGVQKDDLTYEYNGNQLTKVTDADNNSEGFNNGSSGTAVDYLYDGNGNAIQDANRNIGANGIAYSVHNLVQQVTITGGATLVYRYDGAGAKLRMENTNGAVNTKYVGAFEYDKNNYLTRIATEEGQIRITNNGAANSDYSFEYYLTDHLGNTRMVMNEAGAMTQETEYFPFGLAVSKTAGTNRYTFLGKEKQPETGWMDLKRRFYDPTTGRFMQVDPVTADQENYSTYQYGWNNPILRSDPNGDCPGCDDGFLIARLATTAFFETKHAILNTAYRITGVPLRADYAVENGRQVFDTKLSIHVPDNTLVGQIKGTVSAVADVALVATAGSGSGEAASLLGKTGVETQLARTVKYEVGIFNDLKSRSVVGDGLDIHHVAQKHPAGQTVSGYDPNTGPSIALPQSEHVQIPTQRGAATMSPRNQLAKDIRDLRKYTNAPNSNLQQLINLNKSIYPASFFKQP